jgi:2-methylcitrate dehydratase
MTEVEQLADFVVHTDYQTLSERARETLKRHLLDGLGCAIGALEGTPIGYLRAHLKDFGGNPLCTLTGGGKAAPDLATLYNGALVRYLDFNDSYLAKGETCHPSDNIAPVLAAAEYAGGKGRDFLTALAVAYQVQCRLSDVAPVRAKGFDHTTQGSYAVAAGASRALGLSSDEAANALAIAGTAFNALRVTRTGALSHWKGLAYPNTAFSAVHATFLAKSGITGPREVFEGNKGFKEAIAGPFEIDWAREDLERVTHCILKRFNAEIHSQAAIEAALELKREHGFTGSDVESVDIRIFDVAYHIIGGGEEGDKTVVRTKEEADHSLQYMVAVALLDDQVLPPQYAPERITRADVQDLLKRVTVEPDEDYSRRFPDEHACTVTIRLKDGRTFSKEKRDYEGFHTRPMSWELVEGKFNALSSPYAGSELRRRIVQTVKDVENHPVKNLTGLLAQVGKEPQ